MRRILKLSSWTLGLLLAAMVVLYACARLRGPSAAQQAALATLQQSQPTGRNAFPALWLLGYDVPQAQLDAVMQADRRAFAAIVDPAQRAGFQSTAQATHARWQIDSEDMARACRMDCLARIQEDPAPYRALVSRHAALVTRVRAIHGYDYARAPWPSAEVLPTYRPLVQGVRLAEIEDLLAFSAGERAGAMARTCAMTGQMRRLMAGPEALIDSMILREVGNGLAQTYVQMLAALPAGETPPPGCEAAFAPATTQEMSLCEPMRGEFVFVSQTLPAQLDYGFERGGKTWRDRLDRFLLNQDNTTAQFAEKFAQACSRGLARQVAQDLPVHWPPPQSMWRLECVGNFFGCWMVRTDQAHEQYQQRLQDFGAQLRLIGAIAWLREHPAGGQGLEERLRQLPAALGSASRPIEVVEAGRALRVRMYDPREGKGPYWTVWLSNGAGAVALPGVRSGG